MRHIFFILFLISIKLAQAQTVRLTQVEPDVKWSLPVAHKAIPGQTGKYFLKYMQLGKLMDTLGLGQPDSIYLSGDSIKLRDGSGFVILKDTSSTNELPAIYFYISSPPPAVGTKLGDYAWNGGSNWYVSDGSNWYLLSSGDFSIVKNNFTSNDSTYMWRYVHENNVSGDIGIVAKEKTGLLLEGNNNQKVILSIDTSFIATVYDLNKIKDSTSVLNSYGTIITETPANTFNIAVDSTKFATQYDITQISTEPDSIQRSGNIISLRDGSGSVDISDLVNSANTGILDILPGTGISVSTVNGVATVSSSSSGSTEYLDPYVISSDTVGFILKNVMDTVQFIGVAGVTGESTTVSDSPTINMTLTGTNISSEIIDGSITPTKLSQTYLTTEVDGSVTNEIQTLSIAGNNLTISGAGGNTVTLPSGGGSSEWASLHYGSLAANTQTLTSSVWNTINFTGSSESNASVLDANHTTDEIEFVVAGTYRVDYRVSFIANADALIYSGIYSSASSSVDGNTQMESDTDIGYKHTIMQHSYIKTVVAGEKIKLQVQPLIAHTSVAIYSNFIVTKL